MSHVKTRSVNVQTGEVTDTYFTTAEWDAHLVAEQASADAEAARDLKQELLERLDPAVTAFMKVYATREGLGYNALFTLIKNEMEL